MNEINENVSELIINGLCYDDPTEIACKFNESFANIREKFPKTGSVAQTNSTINFKSPSKEKIEEIIKALNRKTAMGLDGTPNKVLLSNMDVLFNPIVQSCNQMVDSTKFPDSLKLRRSYRYIRKVPKEILTIIDQ